MREGSFSGEILKNFFSILKRKWKVIFVIFAIFLGLGVFINKTTVPVYEASTTLLINPAIGVGTDYSAVVAGERLTETYSKMVVTNSFLETVIRRLGLSSELSISGLRGKTSVSAVPNTQLLSIKVVDEDPEKAANIANTISQNLIEENQNLQLERGQTSKKQLDDEINSYRQNITDTQAKIETSKNDAVNLAVYQEKLRTLQSGLADLLKRSEEIQLSELKGLNTTSVIDEAIVPDTPIRPRPKYNLFIAGMLGLFVSFGGIILLEFLDPSFKREEEITRYLGLPILGQIERFASRGKEKPLVLVEDSKSPISESFRIIRTNIRFASADKSIKSILITSSSPQEGKSFITANLAGAFALSDQKTILVDADLRKPTLHHFFGLTNEKGLTDNLLKKEFDKETVQSVKGSPYLKFISSGFLPPNPAELLGSKKLSEFLTDIEKQSDIVIIDSPPTNIVTDSAILGTQVDGVLLVAELGKTNRYLLKQAKDSLDKVGANVLGVILNRTSHHKGYYKSGYYGEAQKTKKTPRN